MRRLFALTLPFLMLVHGPVDAAESCKARAKQASDCFHLRGWIAFTTAGIVLKWEAPDRDDKQYTLDGAPPNVDEILDRTRLAVYILADYEACKTGDRPHPNRPGTIYLGCIEKAENIIEIPRGTEDDWCAKNKADISHAGLCG